jgi:hypothetical protein
VAGMRNPGQACSNVATPFSDCYRFVAVPVNGFRLLRVASYDKPS